jgi:hypothetical protein
MRLSTVGLALLSFSLRLPAAAPPKLEPPSAATVDELVKYLRGNWSSPEDYIVGKFKDHDVVFVGEMHRVRHDVELIHNLIPRLYKAGVRNLGIEFADYLDQAEIDLLITAKTYDADAARRVQFRQFVAWGYVEYMDIYRKAWELNRSLPANAPRFRIVGLNARTRDDLRQAKMTPELSRQVFPLGDGDAYMAGVIEKEFFAKNEKALVYCGAHHAFTRYRQPMYNFEKRTLRGLADSRMGSIVHRDHPSRVLTVMLHMVFYSRDSESKWMPPAGGAIDLAMAAFPGKRVGFDVQGTPFGRLRSPGTYYTLGYDDFRLEQFCDGWIYQKPFADYEGVRVDPKFITEANIEAANRRVPNFEERKNLTKPSQFIASMTESADMKARVREVANQVSEILRLGRR